MEKHRFSESELAFIEGLPAPLAVYQYIDKRVVTLALSDGFCKLFAYADRAEAYYDMDHDMYKGVHPDDVARVADAARRFATEGGAYDVVYRTRDNIGSEYTVIHAVGQHVLKETGARLAYIWYTDEGMIPEEFAVTEEDAGSRLAATLRVGDASKASYHDYLTGLPNMTYFFELAEAERVSILEEGGLPTLLYFDLCGMKFFNAKQSFAEGDKLLRAFSRILIKMFKSECCGHLGSDHFAVVTSEANLEDELKRFFDACQQINGGNSLPVRVGIYQDQLETVPASIACDRAKNACDSLKNTYSSCFSYYKKESLERAELRQHILSSLDTALEEEWVQVYYQPIVRAVNGKISDDEALSRWIDPVRGLLSPAEFIPVLEEAGVVYKLDLFVLDKVLEKIQLQEAAGLRIVPQSINLSRSDFDACDIVGEICKRVDAAGVDHGTITIEVTESIVSRDFEFMKAQINRFHELGFAVWVDDFGSGYSSLDILQSIRFDLIKFDMSFMQHLDGEGGRGIVLTELVKMASALNIDTVCEGVELEEQVKFLQEIGCSKQQGYYYSKPIPLQEIMKRHEAHSSREYENPEESEYYELIGRVNLYDLDVIASEEDHSFHNYFNTLPMGIIEVNGDRTRFARNNQSYRDFIKRFFGYDLSYEGSDFVEYDATFMKNVVQTCCVRGVRSFYDEKMPDGSTVHSFARRIGINPVNGNIAVAVVVLSISGPNEGATYAEIARALAADYYNIYYVDLDTEDFIEYSSTIGKEELAVERHGTNFFESARQDSLTRIYEEDRTSFLAYFNKDYILDELDKQGVFTATYRLIDTGEPMYASMKIMRMQADGKHMIIGVSIVDSPMK